MAHILDYRLGFGIYHLGQEKEKGEINMAKKTDYSKYYRLFGLLAVAYGAHLVHTGNYVIEGLFIWIGFIIVCIGGYFLLLR